MFHTATHSIGSGPQAVADNRTLSGWAGRQALSWLEWSRRRRFRDELRRLLLTAPHMIADIGMTLDEARFEIDKPFWRR